MTQFHGFRVNKNIHLKLNWNPNHDVHCSDVAEYCYQETFSDRFHISMIFPVCTVHLAVDCQAAVVRRRIPTVVTRQISLIQIPPAAWRCIF